MPRFRDLIGKLNLVELTPDKPDIQLYLPLSTNPDPTFLSLIPLTLPEVTCHVFNFLKKVQRNHRTAATEESDQTVVHRGFPELKAAV